MCTQEAGLGKTLTVMYILEVPAAALRFPLQRNLPPCWVPSAEEKEDTLLEASPSLCAKVE